MMSRARGRTVRELEHAYRIMMGTHLCLRVQCFLFLSRTVKQNLTKQSQFVSKRLSYFFLLYVLLYKKGS
jgi:hypothetical protein